ncbi:MAG: efflux RND transporter periplasmic adaptor subunit [Bacteroidota bacterium]|nr:efflux RND transporter periplasmic adaptor subunit [Kiloniellaceae bacterium]
MTETQRKRKPRLRRIALVLAVLVAAAPGGWLAWRATFAEAGPDALATAPVTRSDIRQTVLATGILKPSRLVAVGAQVSGRLTALKVALGDRVAQGGLIAEIDSVNQQNDLRIAEAALANVRAQRNEKRATLRQAELELARQKKMVAQNAVSQAAYEAAEATVATTRAQIEALEAQIAEAEVAVEVARVDLGYTRITAPIDGTVLAVVTQEGQTVNASQQAPTIVVLGRIDVMTVRAEISEADIVGVQPGQPVSFTILGDPARRYEARLGAIEPAPESITGDSAISSSSSSGSSSSSSASEAVYYIGTFEVPNPEGRLRTYMTAEVEIVTEEVRDVLTVPAAALTGGRDGFSVRVVDAAGEVAIRPVEIGLNNKVVAEVRGGLAEGERVVVGQADGGAPSAPARSSRRGPLGF